MPRSGRACCWSPTGRRTSATRTTYGSRWCVVAAAEAGCALAYVNLVGGQDELVFDGDSIVVSADGEVLARTEQFVEGVTLVDLDLPEPPTPRHR